MNAVQKKFASLGLKDAITIIRVARKGIKASIFYSFASVTNMPEKNLAMILHVHPRTVSNYKETNKSFGPVESEHLLKLISLYTKGEQLFGDIDNFKNWLDQPYLDKKETAFEWLNTPGGVDLVSEELDRLTHGYVV
jgi:putative toxin-antitoxin system antitoxin component (TIGR02293 family)